MHSCVRCDPANNSTAKNRHAKNSSHPKNMKRPKMSETARRTLPNIVRLKIGTAKNRISSHVNENGLIGFDFLQGTQICAQNHHLNPGTPTAKNSKCSHVVRKRLTGIVSSQGL
jgi:hypothetical protein